MVPIACVAVVAVVTWMVSSEGIWGAVQTFLCTLLAGLLAMNFFEPLAAQLTAFIPMAYADIVALLGLFTAFVFGLRLGTEQLTPSYIQVFPMLDTAGRYVVGAATGYLTMAILLTALHTAPLPREFMGFVPEGNNFLGVAPDRQWLGFTQYVSEKPLSILMQDRAGDKVIIVARGFDSKYEKVGDPMKPYSVKNSAGQDVPQVIWPSFPIRYAMRRAQLSSGQALAANAPPVQVVPQQQAAPGQAAKEPGF